MLCAVCVFSVIRMDGISARRVIFVSLNFSSFSFSIFCNWVESFASRGIVSVV